VSRPRRASRLLMLVAATAALFCMPAALRAVQKSECELQLDFGVKVAMKGSWNEAAFRFEKAVQADARNARAWNNLGVARESQGRFDAARQAYEKALALAPGDERIRENFDRFQSYVKSTRKDAGAP